MAKKANNRINDFLFDKLVKSPAYQKLLTYDNVPIFNIEKFSGKVISERWNFSTKQINDINVARKAVMILEDFLQSKTSTERGLRQVNRNRINSMKEKTGLSSSDSENFLRFLGSEKVRNLKNIYDSDVLVDVLSVAYEKNNDNINKALDDFLNSGKSLADWKYEMELFLDL